MTTANRERTMAILAAGCLLLLLADRLLLTPMAARYRDRSERVQRLQRDLAKTDALVSQADVWQTRLRTYREAALPADPSHAENLLLTSLRDWAADAQLNIVSMRPRLQEASDDGPPLLELRITATGSLEAIGRFLFDVHASLHPLTVVTVTVTSANDSPTPLSVDLELHGTLWNGTPEQTGKGDA